MQSNATLPCQRSEGRGPEEEQKYSHPRPVVYFEGNVDERADGEHDVTHDKVYGREGI